jgi:hypothetical protein
MLRVPVCLSLIAAVLLAGCDMLGIESATAIAAQREAEGKAIGGACRNAGRAIEDCFALNRKADKAAVLAGWREMNDYMRENKIEPTPPQLTAPTEVAKAAPAAEAPAEDARKPADKPEKPEKGEAKDGKASDARHRS